MGEPMLSMTDAADERPAEDAVEDAAGPAVDVAKHTQPPVNARVGELSYDERWGPTLPPGGVSPVVHRDIKPGNVVLSYEQLLARHDRNEELLRRTRKKYRAAGKTIEHLGRKLREVRLRMKACDRDELEIELAAAKSENERLRNQLDVSVFDWSSATHVEPNDHVERDHKPDNVPLVVGTDPRMEAMHPVGRAMTEAVRKLGGAPARVMPLAADVVRERDELLVEVVGLREQLAAVEAEDRLRSKLARVEQTAAPALAEAARALVDALPACEFCDERATVECPEGLCCSEHRSTWGDWTDYPDWGAELQALVELLDGDTAAPLGARPPEALGPPDLDKVAAIREQMRGAVEELATRNVVTRPGVDPHDALGAIAAAVSEEAIRDAAETPDGLTSFERASVQALDEVRRQLQAYTTLRDPENHYTELTTPSVEPDGELVIGAVGPIGRTVADFDAHHEPMVADAVIKVPVVEGKLRESDWDDDRDTEPGPAPEGTWTSVGDKS